MLLFCVSLVYHGLGLHTFSHWWFEDDANLYAYVRHFKNPLVFFWNRECLQAFSGAMPLQLLTLWIDNTIAYRSILVAHLHQVASLTVTLILIFYVLRGFGLSAWEALVLDLLWLCLPAVVAVNEFLSARFYMEGLAFGLAGILVAQKIGQGSWRQGPGATLLLFGTLMGAALCKEFYSITVPLFVFVYLYSCRKYSAAAISLLVPPLYAIYRIWAVGWSMSWSVPFVGGREYLQFLCRLPSIFVGNEGGYLIVAALVLLCLRRFWEVNLWIAGCTLLLLGSALATIYPVTAPLSRDWLVHGPWYRVMFLLSTMILLGVGYWLWRTQKMSTRAGALFFVALILARGGYVTQRHWHDSMARYKREGRYYLQHKDRLIYSELLGFWYLDGIQMLYEIVPRHHVTSQEGGPLSPEQAATYHTIWRYRDGIFVEDRQLYEKLRGER